MILLELDEVFSNYQGPPPLVPNPKTVLTLNGVIGDKQGLTGPFPTCPPPFSLSFNQHFRTQVGATTFVLTTVNAIAMSKDGAGNYAITITLNTP